MTVLENEILHEINRSHPEPVDLLRVGPKIAMNLGNGICLSDIYQALTAMEDLGFLRRVEAHPKVKTSITASGIDLLRSLTSGDYWAPIHDERAAEFHDEGQNSSRMQWLKDYLRRG